MSPTGRELRQRLPRSQQAQLELPDRDPVAILDSQNTNRIPDLVPIRFGRMLQSPFACYRGGAALMATDLAKAPVTGLRVVACGDAHISNFGFYASPERDLLFDLNDFDEAGIAPWEWDVKRLAASVHIAGRERGMSEAECSAVTTDTVASYRRWIRNLAAADALARFYAQVDEAALAARVQADQAKDLQKITRKAKQRTSEQVLDKMATRNEDGRIRIVEQPPLTRRPPQEQLDLVDDLARQYLATIREDVAYLLSQYTLSDTALRVVGVGSVGTRCYIVALEGPDCEPLFLQAKQAGPSVLETYGGMPRLTPSFGTKTYSHGHRVVAGQRILQAHSDPFLGWLTGDGSTPPADTAAANLSFDYYWRQFRDMKGSFDIATMSTIGFQETAQVCGGMLARAHSQSAAVQQIADYLGKADSFETAVAKWARGYADICERDFEILGKAAERGLIPVERDA